jgi:hypothetical protein
VAMEHPWSMRPAVANYNNGAVAMDDGAVDNRSMNNGTVAHRARTNHCARGGMGARVDDSPRRGLASAMFASGLGEGHCRQCERNERYEGGYP